MNFLKLFEFYDKEIFRIKFIYVIELGVGFELS